MSYDVGMHCGHCGNAVLDKNMTSNLAPMWNKAGAPLRDWDGLPGIEILPKLQRAIDRLERDPEDFIPLAPSNGWGTYANCLDFLRAIRDACARFPDEKLSIGH